MLHSSQAGLAGSADSWESLLIFYFCALQDDWGCYGTTLQESGASTEGKEVSSHLFDHHSHKSQSREERWLAWHEEDSISPVGPVHMYAYTVARVLFPKVMLGKCVRRRLAISRESWSSAA